MGMTMDIRIEELVLHGFDPRDGKRIGEALKRELTRLFTEQGIPDSFQLGSKVERIDGGSFEVGSGSEANQVGAGVAQSVYGGMRR